MVHPTEKRHERGKILISTLTRNPPYLNRLVHCAVLQAKHTDEPEKVCFMFLISECHTVKMLDQSIQRLDT